MIGVAYLPPREVQGCGEENIYRFRSRIESRFILGIACYRFVGERHYEGGRCDGWLDERTGWWRITPQAAEEQGQRWLDRKAGLHRELRYVS